VSTPALYLRTGFVLDARGRILHTREPGAQTGALLTIVKSESACVAAAHASLPEPLAEALEELARREPPSRDPRARPAHAARYLALLAEHAGQAAPRESGGVAFVFPRALPQPAPDVVEVADEAELEANFSGWVPGEIAAGRAPLRALVDDGHPVSVCFCARRSAEAAAAGLETAAAYRGRGLAAHVTAAWATAVRALGLTPLYSTSWSNRASLRVADKLGLQAYAATWSVFR